MKKKNIKTLMKLDGNRTVSIQGKIIDERKVFGRDEVLIDIQKIDPIWLTKERLS